jgi:hypothetical protein
LLAFLDVCYRPGGAAVACVLAERWESAAPSAEQVAFVHKVEPYEPGSFFKRELPCLMAVLSLVTCPLEAAIIDAALRCLNQRANRRPRMCGRRLQRGVVGNRLFYNGFLRLLILAPRRDGWPQRELRQT